MNVAIVELNRQLRMVVSNGMGVEKFVLMTRLAPSENGSHLIKGLNKQQVIIVIIIIDSVDECFHRSDMFSGFQDSILGTSLLGAWLT